MTLDTTSIDSLFQFRDYVHNRYMKEHPELPSVELRKTIWSNIRPGAYHSDTQWSRYNIVTETVEVRYGKDIDPEDHRDLHFVTFTEEQVYSNPGKLPKRYGMFYYLHGKHGALIESEEMVLAYIRYEKYLRRAVEAFQYKYEVLSVEFEKLRDRHDLIVSNYEALQAQTMKLIDSGLNLL